MTKLTYTATVETAAAGHGYFATVKSTADYVNSPVTIFTSLDDVEEYLKVVAFPGAFIHRGGHHLSVHQASGTERLLIIEEREYQETPDFGAIKDAVATARRQAEREARAHGRTVGAPFVRSRGAVLATIDGQGHQVAPAISAEGWAWDGTKRELVQLVARIQRDYPAVTALIIDGAFDISSVLNFEDDYEPRVAEWAVTVWTRREGWGTDY